MDKAAVEDFFGHDYRSFYLHYLPKARNAGVDQMMAVCPFHDDKRPSLSISIKTGVFNCFGCGASGSIFDFYARRSGLSMPSDLPKAVSAIAADFGITNGAKQAVRPSVVARYDYRDESGNLVYQIERLEPKSFRIRRPDGNGGWVYRKDDLRIVPYRLPEIMAVPEVLIVEGEKDADGLAALGFAATTNPFGAGKWPDRFDPYFDGKTVILIPDNDEPGREHMQKVARSLKGHAAAVKWLDLPDLPEKGDASDFLARITDRDEAIERFSIMIEGAREWRERPTANPADGMALTSLRDLMDEPEEAVTWIVDGLLQAGGFSIVAAKPKVGKSTLTRCLALSVATGTPFIGRQAVQGPVIYIALEDRRREVRRHFEDMGCTGNEEIFIFAARAPEDALKRLAKNIEAIRPVLVVIDPLFRFTRMKDEKAYAEVTNKMEPILALARESGAHVCVTHHATKGEREGGDSLLGSTAIFGSVDTAIIEKRFPKYRTISSIQRYGEDIQETTLVFDEDRRMISLGDTREAEEVCSLEAAILTVLEGKTESMTEPEIFEGIEGRRILKRRSLQSLVTKGQVARSGSGKKGDPFRYILFPCSHIYEGTAEQEEGTDASVRDDDANAVPEICCCSHIFGNQNEDEKTGNRI